MRFIYLIFISLSIVTYASNLQALSALDQAVSEEETFWKTQQKGANFFNEEETSFRLRSAKNLGVTWIRLTPSKWKSSQPQAHQGDFLIGPKDHYKGLIKEDLEVLKRTLDIALQENIKVVLTFLNVPKRRWSQHNNGKQERLIWESFEAQDKAIEFFTDLIIHIGKHPALVGINPINEPSPEKTSLEFKDWFSESYEDWYKKIENTPQDLNLFYKKLISSIRKFNRNIPIILDTGFFATPWGIKVLKPYSDPYVLYSVHMYEPYVYTFHKESFSYPGKIPTGEKKAPVTLVEWNKQQIANFLKPIRDWQTQHKIQDNQILVGEFGVARTAPGAQAYLTDVLDTINGWGWHWAFYSFQEDGFAKMDYQLGTEKPPYYYWLSQEKKLAPNYGLIKDQSMMQPIKQHLNPPILFPKPPMGWNSWNWFGKDINEKLIKEQAQALVHSGLKSLGYEYVVIDGGWRADQLSEKGELVAHKEKFPSGIKDLSDFIHSLGLKIGLHVVAGTHDCGGKPTGSFGREAIHAKQLAEWGVDFLKLDQCMFKETEDWPDQLVFKTFQEWSYLLKQSSPSLYFNMSTYQFRKWYPKIGASGRTTGDIRPKIFGGASFDSDYASEFLSVMEIAHQNNELASYAGHGYWNDPDMLVIGDPGLSLEEQKTHFALWSLMTAPLMLGTDLRSLSPEIMSIITNKIALAINQDPTEQGRRIAYHEKKEIWLKTLENGRKAVLLLNRSTKPQTMILSSEDINIARQMQLTDVYSQKNLGTHKKFQTVVGAKSSLFLLITDVHE